MAMTVYNVPPIPPDPENTTYVEGGGLRIGVEWRLLNDEELAANYEGAEMDEVQANIQGDIEDDGISIHVLGASDDKEYLRFDCFSNGPHYHYIEPSGETQTIVDFDPVAHGEMLPWALDALRSRLRPMLERAGGMKVLGEIDPEAVGASMEKVEALAVEAHVQLQAQKGRTR